MERPFEISHSLFPYQSNWCEVDGIPMHYIDVGQGPILLLIHGNFMWSFSYRRLIAALSKSYRCISIDLAGMGMSGKPHKISKSEFKYTYLEQSKLVEKVIRVLNLDDITFLSFDHGGPIGFGVMTRCPERFSRIIIANSWAWSCHAYRSTKIWSAIAPLSTRVLRKIMLKKDRWIFEDKTDLADPEIWKACINPYSDAIDYKPMARLAAQLTQARPYFQEIERSFYKLTDKDIEIIWSTKSGGLFPEFVDENLFLAQWRSIFPSAPTTHVTDVGYYSLVTRPSQTLVNAILKQD